MIISEEYFTIKRINKGLKLHDKGAFVDLNFTIKRINKGLKLKKVIN